MLGRLTAITASGAASPVPSEGTLILRADVSSISVKAYSGGVGGVQIGTTQTPSAASVVYDTIQTTGIWLRLNDGQFGGNALYTCPSAFFETDERTVRVDIAIVLTGGETLVWATNVIVNQTRV